MSTTKKSKASLRDRRKRGSILGWELGEGPSEKMTFQSNTEWREERREFQAGGTKNARAQRRELV